MSHFLDPDISATGFAMDDNMIDYTGLTVRAQIAAMAMQGILSSRLSSPATVAAEAIAYADTLIRKLNETS